MIRRVVPAILVLLAPLLVAAQEAPPPSLSQPEAPVAPPAVAPVPVTARVALETSAGTIVLAIETERAPITAANFLRYVDQGKLSGATFYRAIDIAPDFGLLQGGLRNDPRKMLPPIAHEPTSQTGIRHVSGTISMARNAPGTASGDFFIIVGDMPSFDADPARPGDNLGFAAFGHVVEGMDVVRGLLTAPKSPTEGADAGMVGQILAQKIQIVRARRVPSQAQDQTKL